MSRDDLYWMFSVSQEDDLLNDADPVFLVGGLLHLHQTCSTLLGNVTQSVIAANTVLLFEITQEILVCIEMMKT